MLSSGIREMANIFIIQQHQVPANIHFVRSIKKTLQSFSVEETTFCLLYPLEHENGLFLKGPFKTWLKKCSTSIFITW